MVKDTDVFSNTMKVLDEMERLETFEQQVSFFQQHMMSRLESGSYALVNHFYRS